MDILTTMFRRRSSRSFLKKAVQKSVLESILNHAANAPSAINMQPWEVHIVMDEETQRLSKKLLKRFEERRIVCGPGATKQIPENFINRARLAAQGMTPLIEEMGSDFKTFVNTGSLNFYGAPTVLFLFMDESFPPERFIDIGAFLGYLVLSAEAHGLATCPIGLVTAYEDEIRDALNVPDSKKLAISVAIGYSDIDSPINRFKSERVGSQEFVRWIGV